jgi:hypothetical protein
MAESIEDIKFEGDPAEAIRDILSEVKMNSVGLQYLAKNY